VTKTSDGVATHDKATWSGVDEPVVATSALLHGVTREQIVHAFNSPIASHDLDDDMVMLVGRDSTGQLLKMGVVTATDGGPVVVYAMQAQEKY
jgi:hypothetical protein